MRNKISKMLQGTLLFVAGTLACGGCFWRRPNLFRRGYEDGGRGADGHGFHRGDHGGGGSGGDYGSGGGDQGGGPYGGR